MLIFLYHAIYIQGEIFSESEKSGTRAFATFGKPGLNFSIGDQTYSVLQRGFPGQRDCADELVLLHLA